jgi:molybdopterin-containing oxidoreductase family iron-sulfur binding subunit
MLTLYIKVLMMQSVTLVKADTDDHEFACVQVKTLMGRGDIIKETSLEIFNTKDAKF